MIKTFPFRLDIEKEYNNRMYSVNSNDLKTVKFTFVVTDNGIPLDLTGLTVRIAIRKPDKKAVWQDCTVTNAPKGEVEVILESQAYIKKGEHEAELMLYKGTDTVAITQKFHYRAAEGIMSDKSLKSETVLGPIDEKLAEVEGVIKDIRENGTGVDAKARQDIQSVTTQLADTAKKSDVVALQTDLTNKATKQEVQQLSLTFKESYATLSDLQAAYPNGDNANHVLLADKMIYTYKNGWVSTGIQGVGTGISNQTVSQSKLGKVAQEKFLIGFAFELGARNAETDAKVSNNARIVTIDKISLKSGTKIKLHDPTNYSYILQRFNADGSIIAHYPTWQTGETTITDGSLLYRITMKRNNDANLNGLVDETSSNLLIYNNDSIFAKVDSISNPSIKPLTVNDISGEIDLTKLTFNGNRTVTPTNLTLENPSGTTADNVAKLFVSLPKEVFVELEFEARASELNVAKIGFGFSYQGTITIDTHDYKPYKIREYNRNPGPNAFIQFLTKGTCKLEVRNVRLRLAATVPKSSFYDVRFTGHRGVSDHAPENTMPAFALATRFGMSTVECDIQFTKDGVIVLGHDPTIKRTTNNVGTGTFEEMTYAELLQYDFRYWFGTDFEHTKIPTFEQFIQFCKQSSLHPYIEFKGSGVTLEKATSLINLIKKYGMMDNTTIQGYYQDFQIITNVDTEKRLRLAQSGVINQTEINNLKALGHPCIFHVNADSLTESIVNLSNANGIDVECWTVNDFDTVRRLVKMGVKGITTDHVNLIGCFY